MDSEKEEQKPQLNNQSPDILDTIDSKMNKVDSILSHLKTIFKKHWGTILILALCGLIYYIWQMPDVPQSAEPEQQAEQYAPVDSLYSDSTYYDSTATQ